MSALSFREGLHPPRTIVVKVGSRILSSPGLDDARRRVGRLVRDIMALRRAGIRVVMVSSGAIVHGMASLGIRGRPAAIPLQQGCAAIGQVGLLELYRRCFRRYDVLIGQVLLTWDDLRDKTRYLNLRNTLFALLDRGAVPIINENDSVGIEEIRFGDNDTLGAQIALLVSADVYVLLTDVDGLYEGDPRRRTNARHIPLVRSFTPELHALAGKAADAVGVGGMATKLKAAEIVVSAGLSAVVANGYERGLVDALRGESSGTLFVPASRKMNARRRWIAFSGKPRGTLVVDAGAREAVVKRNKSLLPAGIGAINGRFSVGDTVKLADNRGNVLGRGLTNYSSADIEKIRGLRSSEIAARLGRKSFDEVVHRDNMVVLARD